MWEWIRTKLRRGKNRDANHFATLILHRTAVSATEVIGFFPDRRFDDELLLKARLLSEIAAVYVFWVSYREQASADSYFSPVANDVISRLAYGICEICLPAYADEAYAAIAPALAKMCTVRDSQYGALVVAGDIHARAAGIRRFLVAATENVTAVCREQTDRQNCSDGAPSEVSTEMMRILPVLEAGLAFAV